MPSGSTRRSKRYAACDGSRAAGWCGGPPWVEERALEQDVPRRGGHLGRLAAHDAGEGDAVPCVGDDEIARRERSLDAVEGHQPFGARRAPDHHEAVGDPRQIERVQRLAVLEHHQVGRVDEGIDRPHAGAPQAKPHAER
jgi:hypothetical protein